MEPTDKYRPHERPRAPSAPNASNERSVRFVPGDQVHVPGFPGKIWRVVQVDLDGQTECENSRGVRLWVTPGHLDRAEGPFQTHNPEGC